ncbi:MAG: hypothetical protein C4B56_01555 [Candidatus Methanophagaceae archaeon]|nr:MAG: hypothetical protein C4B56_01555 [Methanophagales archaeon]
MVNWNRLEIIWDEWNKKHVLKHGVRKKEVENALKGEIYVKRMGEVYGVIGKSSGRVLFIVLAERGGNKVYPITAAIRKYLIDKCVERIEKSKRKIEELEKKYDCNYAEFISKISNAEGLKAVEKTSLNWEGDMTEWEYWGNELKEWKARLEDILMKL